MAPAKQLARGSPLRSHMPARVTCQPHRLRNALLAQFFPEGCHLQPVGTETPLDQTDHLTQGVFSSWQCQTTVYERGTCSVPWIQSPAAMVCGSPASVGTHSGAGITSFKWPIDVGEHIRGYLGVTEVLRRQVWFTTTRSSRPRSRRSLPINRCNSPDQCAGTTR